MLEKIIETIISGMINQLQASYITIKNLSQK